MKPDFIIKALVPVIFAAAIGIYGLIIAILINDNGECVARLCALCWPACQRHTVSHQLRACIHTVKKEYYPLSNGFADLAAGLCCGLSGLAAGMAIGVVGDAGVRSAAQQPQMYIGVVLILIFAEALALFGMILGIVLQGKQANKSDCTTMM